MNTLRIGYLPLSDALPLLYARKRGIDKNHDLALELHVMGSWAQLRESLLAGSIDAALCLPGIVLASRAGLYGAVPPLATAFTLNHFGNTITIRKDLAAGACAPGVSADGVPDCSQALQKAARTKALTFAAVFPVAKHDFELRYWLRSQGLDPHTDARIQVIAPPLMADALASGRIDGFCAGEPWGSLCASDGCGAIVANSERLGLPGTEKILAVREDWLANPLHEVLLRTMHESCQQLGIERERHACIPLLEDALGVPAKIVRNALIKNEQGATTSGHLRFAGINRPDRRHAVWCLDQISQLQRTPSDGPSPQALAASAFRSDIYDAVFSR